MSDVKPCPICDASMIKHCPNEKAALKYCGKSMMGELSRLRAELASFKENGCDGCELPLWWAEAIKLRAELAAEKEQQKMWHEHYARLLNASAAAIRASNAAPPQEKDELTRRFDEQEERMRLQALAAPPHVEPLNSVVWTNPAPDASAAPVLPSTYKHVETTGLTPAQQATFAKAHRNSVEHVEPSAAESANWGLATACFDAYWSDTPEGHSLRYSEPEEHRDWLRVAEVARNHLTTPSATEARMLELARGWKESTYIRAAIADELAALVIETSGEKK